MGDKNDRLKNQLNNDHDLLIALRVDFDHFDRMINSGMNSLNSHISEVIAKIDNKVDYKDFATLKEEIARQLVAIEKRIENNDEVLRKLEEDHIIRDTRKKAYVDITTWTFKHWAQVGGFFLTMAALLKAIIGY